MRGDVLVLLVLAIGILIYACHEHNEREYREALIREEMDNPLDDF